MMARNTHHMVGKCFGGLTGKRVISSPSSHPRPAKGGLRPSLLIGDLRVPHFDENRANLVRKSIIKARSGLPARFLAGRGTFISPFWHFPCSFPA